MKHHEYSAYCYCQTCHEIKWKILRESLKEVKEKIQKKNKK